MNWSDVAEGEDVSKPEFPHPVEGVSRGTVVICTILH